MRIVPYHMPQSVLFSVAIYVEHVMAQRGNPLITACQSGQLDVVKALVAHGADVNFSDDMVSLQALAVSCCLPQLANSDRQPTPCKSVQGRLRHCMQSTTTCHGFSIQCT